MPELPEVETIKRGLERDIVGQKIIEVEVRAPKLFIGESAKLINEPIEKVWRRAKVLIIQTKRFSALIHLKMTGQLIYKGKEIVIGGHPDKLYLQPLPHNHTHIIFKLSGGTLYFNDLRKFGWVKVFNKTDDIDELIHAVGPEFDSPTFTLKYFSEKLAKKKAITIKQLLLDQSIVAGIGNIYADEILFASKIHPLTKVKDLTKSQIKKIFDNIPKILNLAINSGGSSSQTYRQIDGKMGTYLEIAKVYKREKLPCKICKTPIKRIKIAGRSSHFCPYCQKSS
ncbi:bifunctional DNA-formamidopyrimidine glycosylase/DNA-(apurinic or apyrimidinic site) lyase [Candidatus Berkelbacteria bacterium]|nr:bifunctional DNA-formamidopyrimidine glycosylase/DNA-(apurinic or apyrimidinic site) lyase [Candidatus Berkelbacteria bacterium]